MAVRQQQTTNRNPAAPTHLQNRPPVIDPRVQDPTAMNYAMAAAGRRNKPLVSKYVEPVGGGPTPPIPKLDGEHRDGHTMAAHAATPPTATPNIIEGLPQNLAPNLIGRPAGLLQDDLLPEEAKQDPAFREGVGSMYAQNQPGLAQKYGVMRKGQRVPPQALFRRPDPERQIRPETAAGLQALEAANTPKPAQSNPVPAAPAQPEKQKLSEGETKELLEQIDDFDFNKFRNAIMRDLLNNDKQREIIEARLKPLDVVDLIVRGYVTQLIPILPGKFEPEFRSHQGDDELTLKKWLVAEAKGLDVDDRYFLDKYAMMGLAVSLVAINKKPLPDCHDQEGNLDEELFWAKFKMVSRFNTHLLSSLFTNWFWFDIRVRKLFVAESLGNG